MSDWRIGCRMCKLGLSSGAGKRHCVTAREDQAGEAHLKCGTVGGVGAVNGSQLPFEISAGRNDELAGNGNGESCLRADGVSRVRGPGVDGGGEYKRDS